VLKNTAPHSAMCMCVCVWQRHHSCVLERSISLKMLHAQLMLLLDGFCEGSEYNPLTQHGYNTLYLQLQRQRQCQQCWRSHQSVQANSIPGDPNASRDPAGWWPSTLVSESGSWWHDKHDKPSKLLLKCDDNFMTHDGCCARKIHKKGDIMR
jgi:hypothetical protein